MLGVCLDIENYLLYIVLKIFDSSTEISLVLILFLYSCSFNKIIIFCYNIFNTSVAYGAISVYVNMLEMFAFPQIADIESEKETAVIFKSDGTPPNFSYKL